MNYSCPSLLQPGPSVGVHYRSSRRNGRKDVKLVKIVRSIFARPAVIYLAFVHMAKRLGRLRAKRRAPQLQPESGS
jgi:hypothetical protein